MAGDEAVPFYLMPVAAIFGMYTVFGGLRVLYLVYANLMHNKKKDAVPPVSIASRPFWVLTLTVVASVFAYAKVVARVDYAMAQSEYSLFDPYEILGVTESSNSTVIKQAYRDLSKTHHPDKGGDETTFQRLNTAYRALTDKEGMANYQQHGHPDGPLTGKNLAFALPEWLLHPEGNVALVLLVLYLGMFASLIYVLVRWATHTEKAAAAANTSVASSDTAYIASKLTPESTHLDVLFCIATTPENINLTQQQLNKAETIRADKLAKLEQQRKKKQTSKASIMTFDDLDEGGWAEDDEDDEDAKAAAAKAKQEEESKAKQRKQLAEATGAGHVPMEGIDDGVLGQKWVEQTLGSKGFWPPPDLRLLKGLTFHNTSTGETVAALDHPAIRRNLVMIIGRLNSVLLNTHPDLLEATSKGLVDQTYFKFNMENRQRTGLLLEACLRVAMSMQSYRLACTVVETVSMFKIGVNDPKAQRCLDWFHGVMRKQYGEAGMPRLKLTNMKVETPGEDEMATGDVSAITMNLERLHAEAFTKAKIAMCQKQGIPPQVALQTYREGWWILVRGEKTDGGGQDTPPQIPSNPLTQMMAEADKKKFGDEKGQNRLLTAWPMIVQNMAQKTGVVKVQFKAPSVPGKYKFFVDVKSQEFLGADQSFELTADVLDAEEVKRKAAEKEKEEEEEDKGKKADDEGKKDK